MRQLTIKNAAVITEAGILPNHSVTCIDGKITRIGPSTQAATAESIDARGGYLAPGYLDLHIHGTQNYLAEAGPSQLEELSKLLPQYGVVGFLPAICPTGSLQQDQQLLSDLAGARAAGATIFGLFLEGHFLAIGGAISAIPRAKNPAMVEMFLAASSPYKVVFAISPEVEGIEQLLPLMTQQGYPAFITHTQASVEQTKKAITAGAVHATHFYDVFPYPGDPDPGVRTAGAVEAILACPDVSVDFILDGEHVDPVVVQMALACKGSEKVCLITDANSNAGLPPGIYRGLCNQEIKVGYPGGPARFTTGACAGLLAGSGLTMDQAVRNAVKFLDLDVTQAVAMAATNPARVLGLEAHKGKIKAGYDADLVLLDQDLHVVKTWVGGQCCFSRKMEA